MILSEFCLTGTTGSVFNQTHFASVSVTVKTGMLWWKKKHVTRRNIARDYAYWYFVDNGEWCPDFQAETLERSYRARDLLVNQP